MVTLGDREENISLKWVMIINILWDEKRKQERGGRND